MTQLPAKCICMSQKPHSEIYYACSLCGEELLWWAVCFESTGLQCGAASEAMVHVYWTGPELPFVELSKDLLEYELHEYDYHWQY